MWPFKRNKSNKPSASKPACPGCGGTNTGLVLNHGADSPNYVKVWRGERFVTYRCFDCGRDFYVAESPQSVADIAEAENRLIDDEEALHQAEEELKRQAEEEDDRTCP